MSGYQTQQTPNYNVQPPSLPESVLQIATAVTILNQTLEIPAAETVKDSASGVEYLAEELLGGYIVRTGHGTNNVTDYFDSATNIILALRRRIVSLGGILKNGTSFKCKLYNKTGTPNDGYLNFYTDIPSNRGTRIGGYTSQITGEATAVLEIIVQDQAALGAGHSDLVFVCISRCATGISFD